MAKKRDDFSSMEGLDFSAIETPKEESYYLNTMKNLQSNENNDNLKKMFVKKEKKVQISVVVSPQIKKRALEKANENNISLSSVVENLLNYYIDKL